MTVRTFLLPDLGEGLTEADVVRWLVADGDTVAVDQPIAEVETAKSLVEVPSPFAGTVTTLHAEAGTTLEVGKPLLSVEDGQGADGGASAPTGGAQSYAEEELAGVQAPASGSTGPVGTGDASESEDDAGSGNVLIGYGTPAGAATGRTRRRKKVGAPAPAQNSTSAPASASTPASAVSPAPAPAPAPAPVPERREAPKVVNPLVRRLARDHGVDVSALQGSGPGGLVLRADVMAAVGIGVSGAATAAATGAVAAADSESPVPAPSGSGEPDARTGLAVAGVEKVTGVRKVTAAAMTRSRAEIPEATVWVDVDVTPLVELRSGMKARGDEHVPGVLAFASRFALAGLARYPALAHRFEDDGEGGHRIVSFGGVNLGFAVQSDRGLMVPAIRRAHEKSARELDGELRRLTELARSGKATPHDLSGGTFTINNYGVFGTDGSAAIINHPEAAILGLGRIIDRPWVVDGELAVRKVMQLSLVFDHRICDGGTAGGFLRYVADCFENPSGVLADL